MFWNILVDIDINVGVSFHVAGWMDDRTDMFQVSSVACIPGGVRIA